MEVAREQLLFYRHGAVVTCFHDACAHLGRPLRGGAIEDGIITCPHHGFRYDLASGECLTAPEVQLEPRAVRIVGGRVQVRLAT
jgi:nitrite reductase/ring-hydroxylating ferredoxin subunit